MEPLKHLALQPISRQNVHLEKNLSFDILCQLRSGERRALRIAQRSFDIQVCTGVLLFHFWGLGGPPRTAQLIAFMLKNRIFKHKPFAQLVRVTVRLRFSMVIVRGPIALHHRLVFLHAIQTDAAKVQGAHPLPLTQPRPSPPGTPRWREAALARGEETRRNQGLAWCQRHIFVVNSNDKVLSETKISFTWWNSSTAL